MRNIWIFATILGLIWGPIPYSPISYAQNVCFPEDGCTGTSTLPNPGDILRGTSDGVYEVVSSTEITSTAATTTINGAEGPDFTFATGTTENVDLRITTSGATITFTPVWTGQSLLSTSTVSFEGITSTNAFFTTVTTTNLAVTGLTDNRLVRTIANGVLQAVAALTDWITGGSGIRVDDDGDGTVTIVNEGVTSLSGGTAIGVSNSTGSVTVNYL